MNDTSETVAALVSEYYRAMTPLERMRVAAGMYETARVIVESSLPAGLSPGERRLAVARRFYGAEVADHVLRAYAFRDAADRSGGD